MNAGQNLTRRIAAGLSRPSHHPICPSCRQILSLQAQHKRHASQSATATSSHASASSQAPPPPPLRSNTTTSTQSTTAQPSYTLNAAVVLSRAPLITRDPTPFEQAFFLYQRRLNERLALPFTRYFYIPADTPADAAWKARVRARGGTAARDIGSYAGYGPDAWNDEVLVGARESDREWQVERLLEDAEPPRGDGEGGAGADGAGGAEIAAIGAEAGAGKGKREGAAERPRGRVTEADSKGDFRSLDRLLQRSLYLLVQDSKGRWVFPQAPLVGREVLHVAAERVLVQSCGINMNTWIVGNAPIGHLRDDRRPKGAAEMVNGAQDLGDKTFFMKARIMAGQADLAGNSFGLKDFKWLAKEEIQQHVTPKYWSAIRNMFPER